jgi:hypothetical protein
MRKAGWVLGVGASILLGPVIYLLARLAEAVAPPAVRAPVVVPITHRDRRR